MLKSLLICRSFPKEECVLIRRFFCCLALLVCLMTPCARAEKAYSDLIRLHVVAESDSAADQALKLALRDTCLRCAEVCIGDARNPDEAYAKLSAHLDDFQWACQNRAEELGFDGTVTAETGVFHFPDRVYGSMAVPAGEYRALRITIGQGEGHNWWCVLYPSLCMLDESHYAGDNPVYYSQILRWLEEKIGGLK